MIPFWSKPTEKALRDLQEAKQRELDEHEWAVQRIVDQSHEGDEPTESNDSVERGVWIDSGSGPGYVRRS